MKIRRIRADWLHVPIPEDRQHTTDFGRIAAFEFDAGAGRDRGRPVGFGEAKAAVGSAGTSAALVTCIEQELAPLLIGEDARDISRLWDVMYNGSRAHYAIARGHAFPILGRRGLTIGALAGIDMALWDLLGKSLGVPVWRLLGGRRQARMPAYASGGWAPADGIAAELQRFVDRGDFKAVKMRVGAGDGTLDHSIRACAPRARGSTRRSGSCATRTAPGRRPRPSASAAPWPSATSTGWRSRSPPTTSAARPRCGRRPISRSRAASPSSRASIFAT